MAVPQQLLALDESVRLEIAHTLLESVERKLLDAALDRSIAQVDAGQGIPVEQAIAEIRARRAARARATR
ncbi:MAG TPA: hypothetical protein VNO30_07500 [Kofleriaceae bacterium]|nr:hypothetical protein [Kofleriaceae bacterium]